MKQRVTVLLALAYISIGLISDANASSFQTMEQSRSIASTAKVAPVHLRHGQLDRLAREDVIRLVRETALRTAAVPPTLALAVARVESNFRSDALSDAGARGVMQIMPATARGEFGVDPDRLWDPRTNIELGVTLLERLYVLYGKDWELALSHYNGGSLKRVDGRWRAHSYTREYVAAVMGHWRAYAEGDVDEPLRVAQSDRMMSPYAFPIHSRPDDVSDGSRAQNSVPQGPPRFTLGVRPAFLGPAGSRFDAGSEMTAFESPRFRAEERSACARQAGRPTGSARFRLGPNTSEARESGRYAPLTGGNRFR